MGFDASVHMIEETKNAEYAGSHAMVLSVVSCCLGGFGLVLAFSFCIQVRRNAAPGGGRWERGREVALVPRFPCWRLSLAQGRHLLAFSVPLQGGRFAGCVNCCCTSLGMAPCALCLALHWPSTPAETI